MKRVLGPVLAVLFVACSGDRPLMPNVQQPLASISDGNHSAGNRDFFFLPPLVPNPSSNPLFQPALFNAALVPVVDVCELSGNPSSGPVSCVGTAFGPVSVTAAAGQYHVDWHTDESNAGAGLSAAKFYRIRVFGSLNGTLLGFADVDPVNTGRELKNLQTNEVIGLVNGRTLPIKFSIEQGALCDPPGTSPCATKTVTLSEGATVVLATGDRVILPPQPDRPGQVITLSIQPCPPLPIDNPKAGPCLNVIASPPLEGPLTVRARVLLCSLDREADLGGLTHEQTHLLKVHRLDEGPPVVVQALPETSADECAGIGSTQPGTFLHWLGRLAWSVIAPRELRASSLVLDVGEGGSTDFFSHFQLALPVKMQAATSTELSGTPGAAVAPSPQILVTDYNEDPVAGAKVHFLITSTGGGTVTPVEILSSTTGHATVSAWVLGAAGAHTLRAFGFGIADPSNNGPQEGFDPFQPDISLDLEDQDPVPVETGQVLFHATAGAAPLGLWTATGNLPAGRRDHTATLLPNGDVLIVGGTATGALIYNADNGQFLATEGAPLFNHGQHATATLLGNGLVLVVGGLGAPFKAELYDPGTGSFTPTGNDTHASRISHRATLLANGHVLLAAGQSQDGETQTHSAAEIYDPGANSFTTTGSLHEDRSIHAAVRLANGQVLVVGGDQTTTPGFGVTIQSAEVYNPAEGDWTLLENAMTVPRSWVEASLLASGAVLVVGGAAASSELFDAGAQTFTPSGSPAIPHHTGSLTALLDGRLLLAAGIGNPPGATSITHNVAEIYDPATGAFVPAANMLASRQQHTATRLQDGRVLVVGGFNPAAGDLNTSEVFSLVPPIP